MYCTTTVYMYLRVRACLVEMKVVYFISHSRDGILLFLAGREAQWNSVEKNAEWENILECQHAFIVYKSCTIVAGSGPKMHELSKVLFSNFLNLILSEDRRRIGFVPTPLAKGTYYENISWTAATRRDILALWSVSKGVHDFFGRGRRPAG